jgi:hypothetical protein
MDMSKIPTGHNAVSTGEYSIMHGIENNNKPYIEINHEAI